MIEITNVSKQYGDKVVLENINLKIERGEIYGLIGLSGAGKSTLLRMINGLETIDQGTISVSPGTKFGFVFQNFNLVNSLTAADNIRLALLNSKLSEEQIEAKVTEALEIVGLCELAETKPGKLSGGQKQRVGIARALVTDCDVLLCDEATSALDPFTANEIIGLLNDLNVRLGLTIVFVSHQIELVKDFCDKLAILDSGHVVEAGTTLDVFSKPQTSITLKLLGTILGFGQFIGQRSVGYITCYHQAEINKCIGDVLASDCNLLATFQHQTKHGKFAHIFVDQKVPGYQVRGEMSNQLLVALGETLYVTSLVSIIVFFVGIGIGVLLFSLQSEKLLNSSKGYAVVSGIVNVLRAIPFIILLIIMMPFTDLIVGKITGANAAIPALVVSVAPMYARLVENTLLDLPTSLLELGIVLELSKKQLITKIILKEGWLPIIGNFTSVVIATIGYGAMAGVIGAGGLGSYAYTIGFQRNNQIAIWSSTALILILVFIIEGLSKKYVAIREYR